MAGRATADRRSTGAERREDQPSRLPVWAGYAACAWAFVFAAMSFSWAAGGTVGVNTNAPAITGPVLAGDPAWIAALWITGALKVIAGLLALALVRPWGRLFPRWLLSIAAKVQGEAEIVVGKITFRATR